MYTSVYTCISVKTDSGMESFAMFKNLQRENNLWAFSLLLDSQQCSLQIQPETDLL